MAPDNVRHICHISTTFNLRSGFARRTSSIIRESLRQGYRVSLLIGRDHDVTESDIPGAGIYSIPQLVKYVKPLYDCRALWEIKKKLTEIKPDIVHTHLAKGGILGRLAAGSAKVPSIMHTVHGPTFPQGMNIAKKFVYWSMEKICDRFTDHFVFVGKDLQQSYIDAGVSLEHNSCVIQTGRPDTIIDQPPLSDARKRELRNELTGGFADNFLIVTVGRIVPAKQLEHAVEILREVRSLGVDTHLAIIGKSLLAEERDYEDRIRQLSRDMGVEEFVRFTGFRQDIVDIMSAADAVLLTSRYEGLPNVAVEALLSGTPMVAYNVSGVREVLTHEKTGYIVKQGATSEAAGILAGLAVQQGKKNHADETERRIILDNFRESVMLKRKIQLYDQISQSLSSL